MIIYLKSHSKGNLQTDMNINFGERLQRYQMSKLEGKRNICRSAQFEPMRAGSTELVDIFSNLQLWPLISLQPLNQNQCLVPHLIDLFHICLEIKVQGFWMTFKVCNCGLNSPIYYIKWDLLILNFEPLYIYNALWEEKNHL